MTFFCASSEETSGLGARLASGFKAGDVVLFEGPLGAGKTTMIRGILEGLGFLGPVRSPTFNLLQVFELAVPVMHADLYRVAGADGIGLEDYLGSHLCLIEWPDRLGGMVDPVACWRVSIAFSESGRSIEVLEPDRAS